MTLTMPNFRDSVRQERVDALTAFRFTERQARFLVTVLIHSGVFVPRQYRAFARIAHGQKTHDFLRRLVGRVWATSWSSSPSVSLQSAQSRSNNCSKFLNVPKVLGIQCSLLSA